MNNLLYDLFGKTECRYKNGCPFAPLKNGLCETDREARAYSGDGTPAGCFRRMAEREQEVKSRKNRVDFGKFLDFISG